MNCLRCKYSDDDEDSTKEGFYISYTPDGDDDKIDIIGFYHYDCAPQEVRDASVKML